jgi:hypothetical protein
MTRFLELLDVFNRKERYFVFTYATGDDIRLSERFRTDLGVTIGQRIPADAKAYIDYHLDWLHAAKLLASHTGNQRVWLDSAPEPVVSSGNQEDVDLVVAWDTSYGVTQLALVEAKAETGWTNKQLKSKAERLGCIFGIDQTPPDAVVRPTFCLLSPVCPTGLDGIHSWPKWMKKQSDEVGNTCPFHWLHLPVSPGRMKVVGCDADGKPCHLREHWMVQSGRTH